MIHPAMSRAMAEHIDRQQFREQDECVTCEGGGWVERFSHAPPAFQPCPNCGNPRDIPSP